MMPGVTYLPPASTTVADAGAVTFPPTAAIFPSFENRTLALSQAGVGGFKAFFHGHDVGVFGGVVWHTPLDGLSLLAEYDSDNYSQEKARGNFSPRNQFNFGVNYDVTDSFKLGLGYLYGRTMSGTCSPAKSGRTLVWPVV